MNEVQQIAFEIYGHIAEICKRHNLRFFVIDGTLLGAVRHQGFIPWDDDIDLGMPRPDFDKFMQIAPNELPEGLRVEHFSVPGTARPFFFAQVLKSKTCVEVSLANETMQSNMWLDIFPYDGMPSNAFARKVKKYRLLYQRMMIQFSGFDTIVHQSRPGRPFHERALMKFYELTKFGAGNDTIELFGKTQDFARKSDYDRSDYVANLFSAYKFREMFPKEWMGDTAVYLPFESIEVPCPREYDKILTQLYGDYMKPVPESQRNAQHCLRVVSTTEDPQ